jgi:NAD(P)H-dependent flavin oxidoreductase YrpB (nitropropane dioxygenase family)
VTNQVLELLGCRHPVVAFTHAPAVVAAATEAGGFGVLGAARFSPEELDDALTAIDAACGRGPYGVDVLYPMSYVAGSRAALEAQIPTEHRDFVTKLARRHEVPPWTGSSTTHEFGGNIITQEGVRELVEVAIAHKVRLIVSALGPLPNDLVAAAKSQGVVIGGMVGSARHAQKHVDAGAQLIVAQGTEAAGHTGETTTMVLIPEVANAVAPVPVLAAGGIATGSQIAAALMLGAAGVWCGSVWLTTDESDTPEPLKRKLVIAASTDTVRSRSTTGKPVRVLRSAFTEAWGAPDAPPALEAPLQGILVHELIASSFEHGVVEIMTGAVGQSVGYLDGFRSVRETLERLLSEAGTSLAQADEISQWL